MVTCDEPGTCKASLWNDGGIPVMGSSFDLSWLMVHEGVIRRSDEAFSDTTINGTSAMAACGAGGQSSLV